MDEEEKQRAISYIADRWFPLFELDDNLKKFIERDHRCNQLADIWSEYGLYARLKTDGFNDEVDRLANKMDSFVNEHRQSVFQDFVANRDAHI